MTTPEPLYHLALREVHAESGAQFVAHAGWSLPASYQAGTLAEHTAIRTGAAVIDRSHRSRILVTGTDALVVLQAAFAGHIEDLEEGRSMRTARLDGEGRIRDLVLVARTGGISYLVTGEPSQRAETLAALQGAVGDGFEAQVDDRTETTCLISVSGPEAAKLVSEHMADALPSRLPALHCVAFLFHGFRGLAVRTSDTGEDGFEFMLAPAVAQHLIETLRPAAPLAGLQATEIARVEAAVPAFVPDLEPGLSPAEADLDVLFEIPGGADGRILSGMILEGDPLPPGSPVSVDGEAVGELRSCLRSPGLNATIGLGIISSRRALPGTQFSVAGIPATVVAKPFYRRRN